MFVAGASITVHAQKVGIGTNMPQNSLSVNNSLGLDQSDSMPGTFDSTHMLRFGSNSKEGMASRRTSGTGKNGLDFYTRGFNRMRIDSNGNVGIGTSSPQQLLDVNGYVRLGVVGVGKLNDGLYPFEVSGTGSFGEVRATNLLADVAVLPSISGSTIFSDNLIVDGTSYLQSTSISGNLAVSQYATLPTLLGNTALTGNLTVNNGKGVISNSAGSTQLKYYTRTAGFQTINLTANGSILATMSFTAGFAHAPQVMVGQVTPDASIPGEWWKIQIIPFNVTKTGCSVRIYNNSGASVSSKASWQIICIGD